MKQAEHYVRVFIDNCELERMNADIARSNNNTLNMIREHQGHAPSRTAGPRERVSNKAAALFSLHPDYPRAVQMIRAIPANYATAALAWEYYRGRTVEIGARKKRRVNLRSGEDVARYLNMPYQSFKHRRRRAHSLINAKLGFFSN